MSPLNEDSSAHGTPHIAVVGLGYVGLPLAVALARHFPVTGYDVDGGRVEELRRGHDRTGEVSDEALRASTVKLVAEAAATRGAEVFIITVPTPVDADNRPDLGPLKGACRGIAPLLGRGAIVCVESTVYPGVTEDICGPELEAGSGLECGVDFFLGYSPERINPGDREHTVDRIVKVVSGQTQEVTDRLAAIYAKATTGGVFRARDIKTAEAAKVIENAQRDINIAFINEVTMIFQKLGLSAYDVLEAAGTKWNFLPFTPGLVGGHCIGVDPYYLAHRATEIGHHPEVILSGRKINDAMGAFVAGRVHEQMAGPGRILVLGLTFKENVPDLRNTKVVDIVEALKAAGHEVTVHDPLADAGEARRYYGIELAESFSGIGRFDAVVGAVPHDVYRQMTATALCALLNPGGLLADIKGMWRGLDLDGAGDGDGCSGGFRRWQL